MSKRSPKPITDEDINEFLKQVAELHEFSLVKDPPKIKVTFGWNHKNGPLLSSSMPSKEAITSLMTGVRPFIVEGERLYLGRIIAYLIEKHGPSRFLEEWCDVFYSSTANEYATIIVGGKPYGMEDFMDLYMNGKYLHLDKKKQKVYRALERTFGSLVEFFALSQLERYIGIIFAIAGYVRHNLSEYKISL